MGRLLTWSPVNLADSRGKALLRGSLRTERDLRAGASQAVREALAA